MHVSHTTRCCVVAMATVLGASSASTPAAMQLGMTQQQITANEQHAGIQPMSMPTQCLPPAYQGMPFFSSLMASGGVGPYKVFVTGDLPPGLTYEPGGNVITLNGVPTATGSFNAQFTVVDANGAQVSRAYSMEVRPISRITPSPAVVALPEAMHINDAVNVFFAAVINVPEVFHITDGMMDFGSAREALPEVFHINDTTTVILGVQYGLPEAFHINDKTTVFLGAQYGLPEAFHINDKTTVTTTVGILPATTPPGQINVAYSQTFNAAGNTGAATLTPTGTLPTGMSFTAPGSTLTLSDTPTVAGTFPFTIKAQDSVSSSTTSYSLIISLAPQTITLGAIPSVTYGGGSFGLSATASPSGLPVTINSTSGLVTGTNPFVPVAAGTATFTATQAGNASYAATTVNFNVPIAQATLNVVATNVARAFDQPNPSFSYSFGTFVNGDSASVVSGAPAFTTVATPLSPISGNPYAINIAQGTLAAANYSFSFTNGTLTVINAPQTITFRPLPTLINGSSFYLTATASSGLPVSYTVSGPAGISNNVLSVTGSGLVQVTALQTGSTNYNAATPVVRSFTAP